MVKVTRNIALILVLALILAACGGNGDADGDTVGEDTTALTQSVTYQDEFMEDSPSLTVSYPEDWVADTDFGLLIGSTQNAIDQMDENDPSIGDDDQLLLIDVLPAMMLEGVENLDDVYNFMTEMSTETDTFSIGEPTSVTIGGNDARRMSATERGLEGTTWLIEIDGQYIIALYLSGGANNVALAESILATIELS